MNVITGRSRKKDLAVAAALCFFAFRMVYEANVPLLNIVDIGMHGIGRVIGYPLPPLVKDVAGSFVQVGVPMALALYFFVRDEAGAALCLGWSATNMLEVARNMADAPAQRLPAIWGQHDWTAFFGQLHMMSRAAEFADYVRFGGWVMMIVAFAILAHPYLRSSRTHHPAAA